MVLRLGLTERYDLAALVSARARVESLLKTSGVAS